METTLMLIIGGLLLTLIFLIVLLFVLIKKINNNNNNFENNTFDKDYNNFKLEVMKLINESNQFSQTELNKSLDNKFDLVNRNVNKTISDTFSKTDKTFTNVIERLTKIDEQNKNINKLSKDVLTLNNILTDKQTRGTFGEVQLNKLLEATLGNNESLYTLQTKLPNGRIPDATIFTPKPLGMINIDSKFPLENYQNYINPNNTKEQKEKYAKLFNKDLKDHINDIKERYIIHDITADQAIMFIPAEAIYLEIVSNHFEIINYAYKNNVWITSPTTLIASLTVVEAVSNSIRQTEETKKIVDELKWLANEFRKFKERSDNVSKRINTLKQEMDTLNITNNLLYNRFKDINEGKLD